MRSIIWGGRGWQRPMWKKLANTSAEIQLNAGIWRQRKIIRALSFARDEDLSKEIEHAGHTTRNAPTLSTIGI